MSAEHQSTINTPELLRLGAAAVAHLQALRDAVQEFLAAEDEVEREARRAEQPGAPAWSTAPTVRRIHAVKKLRELAE